MITEGVPQKKELFDPLSWNLVVHPG